MSPKIIIELNIIAPKEHSHLTGLCSYVRACVRAPRWKILLTPYLVVELSPSAEIWCVHVTSNNDGTQILTFLKIDNKHDFQNSRFFCGNLIILNSELRWFLFSDWFHSLHSFPELCTHSQAKMNISVGYSQRYLCLGCLCSGWESLLYGIAQFKKHYPDAQCGIEYYIMYYKFSRMQKCEFLIFGIFLWKKKMSIHIIN